MKNFLNFDLATTYDIGLRWYKLFQSEYRTWKWCGNYSSGMGYKGKAIHLNLRENDFF